MDRDDPSSLLAEAGRMREELARFMHLYSSAIDEVSTKLRILKDEFALSYAYSPIETVATRLKTPESLLHKIARLGIEPTLETVREHISDIAGVRVITSFVSDTYRVFDLLTAQQDVRLLEREDYIAQPKPNGYRSLHALIEVPVNLSTGPVPICVEVQIRTIAMDFWASLEHKIYYKYDTSVPAELLDQLRQAASTAADLDADMERLHHEIRGADRLAPRGSTAVDPGHDSRLDFPLEVLEAFFGERATPPPPPPPNPPMRA